MELGHRNTSGSSTRLSSALVPVVVSYRITDNNIIPCPNQFVLNQSINQSFDQYYDGLFLHMEPYGEAFESNNTNGDELSWTSGLDSCRWSESNYLGNSNN
jgi:hypothetical protein